MKASKALVTQRDFLLANTWVPRAPAKPGEGCLVERVEGWRPEGWRPERIALARLDGEAVVYLWKALRGCDPVGLSHESIAFDCAMRNDMSFKSAGEAIDALDEAIILAKEGEANEGI